MAEHYARAGYRVLARNLRTTAGELDVVASRGNLLVAVEVKTRRHQGAPEREVGDEEIARRLAALRRVARALLPTVRRLRVDVAAVRWRGDTAAEIRTFQGSTLVVP